MSAATKNAEVSPMHDEHGNFAKGNPGGPGRPKGSVSLKSALDRMLKEHVRGSEDPREAAEQLAEGIIRDAVAGDAKCREMLLDRYYPKTTRHEILRPLLQRRNFREGEFEEIESGEDDELQG